jgi:acyl-CoA reductase-like NAD-dependent aldehyde dehydrogenase
MISKRQQQNIARAIEKAIADGAKIAAQAQLPLEKQFAGGNWIAPTMLSEVTDIIDHARRNFWTCRRSYSV